MTADSQQGLGLVSMRERAELSGGAFAVHSGNDHYALGMAVLMVGGSWQKFSVIY